MSEPANSVDPVSDIQELLVRAYKFDDKPHQLFSFICSLARKYNADEPRFRDEVIRLMDIAYRGVSTEDLKKWEKSSK